MQPLVQIATLIIQTLASLYLFFIAIRFLLQLARADFYNPISQAVVKVTNPALIPLRKIIPGVFGVDMASVVLALLVSFIAIELNLLIAGGFVNPANAIIWALLCILKLVTYIIVGGLIITIVASFIAPYSRHPALVLVHQLMEPIRLPFSRILPPMGGLDFSPILIFLTVQVVWIIIDYGASASGLGIFAAFVPGF